MNGWVDGWVDGWVEECGEVAEWNSGFEKVAG